MTLGGRRSSETLLQLAARCRETAENRLLLAVGISMHHWQHTLPRPAHLGIWPWSVARRAAMAAVPPTSRQQQQQQQQRQSAPASAPPAAVAAATAPPQRGHAPKRRRLQPCAAGARAATVERQQQRQSAPGDEGLWLIVGLGNPGPRYEKTRHNVGFMAVDALARSAGADMRKLEKSAAVGRCELAGRRLLLAKPVTFMNNSGEAVAALARFYKIPQQRVLVIADDLDQPPAAVRLRQRGGHGGHNGLRSIINHFGGSHDFPRLKIGIGRPSGELDVASYVLQEFRRSEMEAVDKAIEQAMGIVESCVALGLDKALSGSRL